MKKASCGIGGERETHTEGGGELLKKKFKN